MHLKNKFISDRVTFNIINWNFIFIFFKKNTQIHVLCAWRGPIWASWMLKVEGEFNLALGEATIVDRVCLYRVYPNTTCAFNLKR